MEIITDEILHLYILNRNLVEKSIIAEIEEKIGKSDEFRERIDKIRTFHQEYEKHNTYTDPFKNSNTIELFPLQIEENQVQNSAKLAANNEPEQKDLFKYQRTFASASNLILLRLHYNYALKKSRLYLISEDMKSVANVKVRIPELNREFISDSKGIIEFDGTDVLDVDSIIIEK